MRGGVLSLQLLAGACVVSVLAVPGALADKTTVAADIMIEYQYPYVTVRVGHRTHLLPVLDELCQQTNANCELGPELGEVPLEPMIIQGTWYDVVRKLFEGTQFDLAATAPSPEQAGRLLVRRRMSAKAVEQPAVVLGINGTNQADGAAQSKVRGDGSPLSPSAGAEPPGTRQSSTPEGLNGLFQGQSGVALNAEDPEGRRSRMERLLAGQATQPSAAGGLSEDQARTTLEAVHDLYVGPPAGSFPSPPPGMAVLPFPDENGNPILIRITNQPITTLPFPDPQGRPVPVAPGVPGLKVQDPFPSTPTGQK
jgi:hypothetical protein